MRQKQNWMFLGLLIVGCSAALHAQKVKVEYDKEADFARYKTYSWMKLAAAAYPFVQWDVVGAVDNQLAAKGLKKVDNGGDLLVNGCGAMNDSINVSYAADVYAMPGLDAPITWANGTPLPGNSSTAQYVDKGTLVVDLVDRQSKQLKWRGTAKANLDPEQQEKSLEIIEKAVVKMFKEYPSPGARK
jgi:Domain of unknown function (DUF4136)